MSEPVEAEGNPTNFPVPKLKSLITSTCSATNATTAPIAVIERESFMMMDLDLDGSWTFDQIFSPDPTSPFLLSDRPYSPLWTLSDVTDAGNLAGGASDAVNETQSRSDEKRRIPPPVLGFLPLHFSDGPGPFAIKERMTQALRYLKESTEQHILAQVWAPVKNGDRYALTTSGQPFVLDPNTNELHQYRMASVMYMFSVDGESDGGLGLPGRVFRQKLPEWTPNVQFYSSKEYPRRDDALHYNVQGTLALPVFEPSGQSCVGVLELIMTSQKINYAPEVDKVCKALEAVNLRSSEILDHPNTKICNEGRQNVLTEILEILTLVCETHKLPLAQTWVPCRHRSILSDGGGLKKSCSSFDGSCIDQVCMSTTDVAFYIVDAHMWGFREACSEHHLLKGQGVAGRAFSSKSPCFCEDITQFSKPEYPLVHYARLFRLTGSFAICLQSNHTGDDSYILEFFIPPSMLECNDRFVLLDSLLATMKQQFRSLKVASGKEIDEEGISVEIIKVSLDGKPDLSSEYVRIPQCTSFPCGSDTLPNEGETTNLNLLGKTIITNGFDTASAGGNLADSRGASVSENKVTRKKSERKRGKAEKCISLDVLQQYFSGSLKDAAKSLGVCPTTMKRICRQHGISRWPSRKINKVNRSLSKLKRVIESVQGAEGAFTLTSLATSSLPAGVGTISWPASLNGPNQQITPDSIPSEFPEENNEIVDRESGERSKTGSGSKNESTGTPTSHASCQGDPFTAIDSLQNDQPISHSDEQFIKVASLFEVACEPIVEQNLSAPFSVPVIPVSTETEEPFGGMLIEDAGSSHDLKNLCSIGGVLPDKRVPEEKLHFSAKPEVKTVTIKATYKEDIIRFRLLLSSGMVKLKEEVAKRLKLELGTFDVKYLDDDHEWVLIACDADLLECADISRSSGSNIIRLLVHDIMANLGSSCESSG